MTVALAVWFGVLAGLPHTHRSPSDSAAIQDCLARHTDQPTDHLHRAVHEAGRTCLACLVSGTTASPPVRAVDLRPSRSEAAAAATTAVRLTRSRSELPSQRGPPATA